MAVFDPFMMGGMLLFKIALPLLLVAAAYCYIAHLRGNPEPETRNPKPETRNPKPETRNPKP
jgi:hypothetical protein